MKLTLFGISLLLVSGAMSKKLFSKVDENPADWADIEVCHDGTESCSRVEIDFEALSKEDTLELTDGLVVKRMEVISKDDGVLAVAFGDEAKGINGFFEYSTDPKDQWANGDVEDAKAGKHYTLDPCEQGPNCYVWARQNCTLWNEEDKNEKKGAGDAIKSNDPASRYWNADQLALLAQGRQDTNTVAEVSITIHTTPEFRASFQNDAAAIKEFVEKAISESNQGYEESKVMIRMKLHCIVDSTLSDANYNGDLGALLGAFKAQNNYKYTRRDADVALILSTMSNYCGIAYFDVISNGQTLGCVYKGCATGYYSFAHEIAHMYGCAHNVEESGVNGNAANGYLMKPPLKSGFRSIMGYGQDGYYTRINRYSNPLVTFSNVPTGTQTENNALQLNSKRFAMSNVGAEFMACNAPAPPAPTPPAPVPASCRKDWITDKYCDDVNNNSECMYDGGDCCNNSRPGWNNYCKDCSCKQNAG